MTRTSGQATGDASSQTSPPVQILVSSTRAPDPTSFDPPINNKLNSANFRVSFVHTFDTVILTAEKDTCRQLTGSSIPNPNSSPMAVHEGPPMDFDSFFLSYFSALICFGPGLPVCMELFRASGLPSNEKSSSSLQRVLAAPCIKAIEVKNLRSRSQEALNELIQSIIEKQNMEDPFYVLDLGVVVDLWHKWREQLPRARPFYAVKCNPEPALLAALAALGAGFDCASQAEMEAVLRLGVSADRIVYANPCKAETQLQYAASVGVNVTTFDSKEEVEKIRTTHPRCALLLRVRAPEDGGARCPLGPKYGALPEEVRPLLQAAQRAGLTVVGVSFHVGSGATHDRVYTGAIEAVRSVFDTASELGLPRLRVLNVGGGFTAGVRFTDAAATVRSALQTYFPDQAAVSVMAEPGRYFAESAFALATNIIGKRVRGELREYWINDGIYGSMNCLLYDHAVISALPLACTSRRSNPSCSGLPTYRSTVFGPTCDALDTVLVDHSLPELAIGDWLVFPNMGAYTASAGSNFNGFSTSAICTYSAVSLPSS
eukprot:Gb_37328 [translate_table: standard]